MNSPLCRLSVFNLTRPHGEAVGLNPSIGSTVLPHLTAADRSPNQRSGSIEKINGFCSDRFSSCLCLICFTGSPIMRTILRLNVHAHAVPVLCRIPKAPGPMTGGALPGHAGFQARQGGSQIIEFCPRCCDPHLLLVCGAFPVNPPSPVVPVHCVTPHYSRSLFPE